jgi:homoserine kinase
MHERSTGRSSSPLRRAAAAVGRQSAGILLGNVDMLGQGLSTDCIVEPARGPLIPGFKAVKEAALCSGAAGCTISGAGPTIVAVSKDKAVRARLPRPSAESVAAPRRLERGSGTHLPSPPSAAAAGER